MITLLGKRLKLIHSETDAARDANGEVVKAKQGLLRRMKSVGTADGSSLILDGESKIFKVYDRGVMKAIRYFKASDGHYYAGCYLKAV